MSLGQLALGGHWGLEARQPRLERGLDMRRVLVQSGIKKDS